MEYFVTPWKHQQNAIDIGAEIRDLALFYDVGTGKSLTTVNILRHKFARQKQLLKTLIVCPNVVKKNWKREFLENSKVNKEDIIVLEGPGSKKLKHLTEKTGGLRDAKIIIANYESISRIPSIFKALFEYEPEVIVVDESHRIKNPSAEITKKIWRLGDKSYHNYILSGTPFPNSMLDIFAQFRFLDRGKTFGKNFYVFRNTYFYDENAAWASKPGHFPSWAPKKKTALELNNKIYEKALRIRKEECLDLPPFVEKKLFVDMSKEQTKAYKEMKNEFITFIGEQKDEPQAVVAQMAVTKALRLQQIASGFVRTEEGKDVEFENCPRVKAVEELLPQITKDKKVIVWCQFKKNYDQIRRVCEELGIRSVEIHGGVSEAQKNEAEEIFKNGKVNVLIANPQSCGEGMNLQEASYSVIFSRGFSYKDREQARARNYRGGSEIHESVTEINLICQGTIDEVAEDAIKRKKKMSEIVLGEYGKF